MSLKNRVISKKFRVRILLDTVYNALRSDVPGFFVSRYLYLSANKDIGKRAIKKAKIKLQVAIAVERFLQLFYWRGSHGRINSYPRKNSNSRVFNGLSLLYARYRYVTYFGDLREAARLREQIVSLCSSRLKKTAIKKIGLFEVCAAIEGMDFKKISSLFELLENKIQLNPRFLQIKNFVDAVINLTNEESSWVNVIGPNYSSCADCDLIRSVNLNVCLNKPLDFTLCKEDGAVRCDVVYVNKEFLYEGNVFPENADESCAVLRCRIENYAYAASLLEGVDNIFFGSYYRPKTIFINGNANMAQAAVYDLIMRGFKIKLIGVDFFTLKNLYEEEHYSAKKKKAEVNIIERNHDLLSNFAFLKMLHREGVVMAEGSIKTLNKFSIKEYAEAIQENFGFLEY